MEFSPAKISRHGWHRKASHTSQPSMTRRKKMDWLKSPNFTYTRKPQLCFLMLTYQSSCGRSPSSMRHISKKEALQNDSKGKPHMSSGTKSDPIYLASPYSVQSRTLAQSRRSPKSL